MLMRRARKCVRRGVCVCVVGGEMGKWGNGEMGNWGNGDGVGVVEKAKES